MDVEIETPSPDGPPRKAMAMVISTRPQDWAEIARSYLFTQQEIADASPDWQVARSRR